MRAGTRRLFVSNLPTPFTPIYTTPLIGISVSRPFFSGLPNPSLSTYFYWSNKTKQFIFSSQYYPAHLLLNSPPNRTILVPTT
ncbi:hypothetical protein AG1IA_01270 [Rhizoctonia solani AG-1 IA]|uniref:Uncharacterized protein n=1 Tax=Thanatephorus cucumeris (strain AG1-IA) TaxID=983506 RepID=L8X315_THACA|nr:hypothetical protein AG1IA_01270 [Rhizoctonia solani AG-1 IA]